MSAVSATFRSRWKSGEHVGVAAPRMKVYLRRGRWRRGYQPWQGDDMAHIYIPGESAEKPWQATWQGRNDGNVSVGEANIDPSLTFEPWLEVPNAASCTLEQGFDENGLNRSTITLENVVLAERAAASPMAGVFHVIERGYLSPWRGYAPPGRTPEQTRTPWYDLLFRNVEIRVDQGYGDELVTTFKGAIDDLDLSSAPDRIVVTARDFGQQLVDSHVFGWNTSKQLRDPIIFADRYKAEDTTEVGGGAAASSSRDGYRATAVADNQSTTAWYSSGHTIDDYTEWVEVRLPRGRYRQIILECAPNMEAYIGIYCRGDAKRNGNPIGEGFAQAAGVVPGANGGWNAIKKVGATHLGRRKIDLGATYDLGDDSVLRVGFRGLQRAETGRFHAIVMTLRALRVTRKTEAKKREWIVVDDVSDVVRVILRWAGFKEWRVENTGARLKDNFVVNRGDFYMDVIRKCCDQTGFEFFMGDPTDSESLGVPTFRMNAALRRTNAPGPDGRPKPRRTIRDTDLLTGMSVKLTDEPLRYIIRVRGARASRAQGGKLLSGATEDTGRRRMFVWRPPWTQANRMGGFIKHLIHYDNYLKTDLDCEIAAYLIGLAEALKSATAIAQIPGNPEFELDDQVWLIDRGTGLETRLWIASRSSTFNQGEHTNWQMTLGGSLIDTPDIVAVKQLIHDARAAGKPVPQVVSSSPQVTTIDDAPIYVSQTPQPTTIT